MIASLGGSGADHLFGDDGAHDTADYTDSTAGVGVNLATGAGAGGTAAGDVLESIEDVLGSAYDDNLTGNDLANYLYGGNGQDLLKGGGGADYIDGSSGNDTLKGGGGADILIGGIGIDTVSYNGSTAGVFVSLTDGWASGGDGTGDAIYTVENATGSAYSDALWGDYNANVLNGGSGDDSLKGYGGDDSLIGGSGIDRLQGDAGADVLTGGADADQFVWLSTADTGVTFATADVITDFSFAQGDRIDVSGIDADVYASGNQAFRFIGTAAFTGAPGEINVVYANGDTVIQFQTGTSTDIEGAIRLSGVHTPDASWFLL